MICDEAIFRFALQYRENTTSHNRNIVDLIARDITLSHCRFVTKPQYRNIADHNNIIYENLC